MRTIQKPEIDIKIILKLCTSNMRDLEKKSRILQYQDSIIQCSNEYDFNFSTNNIHNTRKNDDLLIKEDMVSLYDDKFSKHGQPGRNIYNQLKTSSKYGLCPICCQQEVDTLDHHLPKAVYPFLSIVPINLVPECIRCNKIKLHQIADSADKVALNPYFDDVNDKWMYAKVIETVPFRIEFFVSPPENWDEIKKKRVENHFSKYQLGSLFSKYAAQEVNPRCRRLFRILCESGPEVVKYQISNEIIDCKDEGVNFWKTVTYEALFNSEWFINIGLELMNKEF